MILYFAVHKNKQGSLKEKICDILFFLLLLLREGVSIDIEQQQHIETLAYFPPHSDLLYSSSGGEGGLYCPNAASWEERREEKCKSSHSKLLLTAANGYTCQKPWSSWVHPKLCYHHI